MNLPDTFSGIRLENQGNFLTNSLHNPTTRWLMGASLPSDEDWTAQGDQLKTSNRLTASATHQFKFTQLDSSKQNGLVYAVSFEQVVQAQVSRDALDLLMNGNGHMNDYQASLSNSNGIVSDFFTAKMGLQRKLGNTRFQVLAGPAIGTWYSALAIDEGSVFVADQGEYLNLDYDLSQSQSNFGLGLAVDASALIDVDESQFWHISARNLGFMQWFGNATQRNQDTAFRYDGIVVDGNGGIGASSLGDEVDTLWNSMIGSATDGSFKSVLPVTISAGYHYIIDPVQTLEISGAIRYVGGSLSHWEWIAHSWKVGDGIFLVSAIDAYDFSALNWREEFIVDKPKFQIGIGLTGMDGFMVARESGGAGARFTAALKL